MKKSQIKKPTKKNINIPNENTLKSPPNPKKTAKKELKGTNNPKYAIDFPHKFSEEQVRNFRDIFIFFDRNGDGLISTEELGIALRSLGFLVSTIDVIDLIKKIDPSKTGEIDMRRFFMAINLVNVINKEENAKSGEILQKAFHGFDKENSGKINAEEFKKVMMTLGDVLQEHEIDFVLRDAGVGKDKMFDIEGMTDLLLLKKFK